LTRRKSRGLSSGRLGQDFFPQSDAGQFILHIRATGSRIEEIVRLSDLVEDAIREKVPPAGCLAPQFFSTG